MSVQQILDTWPHRSINAHKKYHTNSTLLYTKIANIPTPAAATLLHCARLSATAPEDAFPVLIARDVRADVAVEDDAAAESLSGTEYASGEFNDVDTAVLGFVKHE